MNLIKAVSYTATNENNPIIVIDGINQINLLRGTEDIANFEDLLAVTGGTQVKVFGVSTTSQYHLSKIN